MNRKFKSILSNILIVAILCGNLNITALASNEIISDNISNNIEKQNFDDEEKKDLYKTVNTDKILEMVKTVLETVNVAADDDVDTVVKIANGIVNAGVVTVNILQLAGVIKDPTEERFKQISAQIDKVQDSVSELKTEMESLNNVLQTKVVRDEEKDLQNKADAYIRDWNEFSTNYTEKLDKDIALFEEYSADSIRKWWVGKSDADIKGINVFYATRKVLDSETISVNQVKEKSYSIVELFYSDSNNFPKALPENYSDYGYELDDCDIVIKDESFGINKEDIPVVTDKSFNIETYRNDYIEYAAPVIIELINGKKLIATDVFYSNWSKLSDVEKIEQSKIYAGDLIDSIAIRTTIDAINDNSEFKTNCRKDYINYANNLLKENSGINSLLNLLMVTHSFEGEIKDDIENICNNARSLNVYYASFALSVAKMDQSLTSKDKVNIVLTWSTTENNITTLKNNMITGNDNYCYLVGAPIKFNTYKLSSTINVKWKSFKKDSHDKAYESWSSTKWVLKNSDDNEVSNINAVDAMHMDMLYHRYQAFNQAGNTNIEYWKYLNNNGVNINSKPDDKFVCSAVTLNSNLPLSDKVLMKAYNAYGNTFTDGSTYAVNNSNVKDESFQIHDCVRGDTFSYSDGTSTLNNYITCRALYEEHHKYWHVDEGVIFYTDTKKSSTGNKNHGGAKWNEYWDDVTLEDTVSALEKTAIVAKNSFNMMDSNDGVDVDLIPLDNINEWIEAGYVREEENYNNCDADWSMFEWNKNSLNTEEQYEKLKEGVLNQIEIELDSANLRGNNVTLTSNQKQEIVQEIIDKLEKKQSEINTNKALSYFDVLSIDGYDEKEYKLAKAVLPKYYFNEYDECIIPTENMTVILRYEPFAFLKIEDGKENLEIDSGFEISPKLVIWDPKTESFEEFAIIDHELISELGIGAIESPDAHNNIFKKHGFEMKVRIPVSHDTEKLNVNHYNSTYDSEKIASYENINIFNDGHDYYAEIVTDKTGMFELVDDSPVIFGDIRVADVPNQIYTATAIKPVIKVYDGNKRLELNKDYKVEYKNNINAGMASFTVKGVGNYNDSVTGTFLINKINVNDKSIVTDDFAVRINGSEIRPVPSVTWNGKAMPRNSMNVSYYKTDESGRIIGDALSSIKEAGIYIAEIKGEANFTGTRSVKLFVNENPKNVNTLTVAPIKDQKYTGKYIMPTVVIKDKGKNVDADNFSIKYLNNKNAGIATIVITGKKEYVGTKQVTFKIVGTPVNKACIEGIPKSIVYTGKEITVDNLKIYLKATKTAGSVNLTQNKDYVVKYSNNINAGIATIQITGINGCSGTVRKTFRIIPYKETDSTKDRKITVSVNQVEYSKGGAKPETQVYFISSDGSYNELKNGIDYTLSFSNNKAVNDGSSKSKLPTVKVSLKGNYAGNVTSNFVITPKDISKCSAIAADKAYKNKQGAYISNVNIYDTDGKRLVADKDYSKDIQYYANGELLDKNSTVSANTLVIARIAAKEGSGYTGETIAAYRIGSIDIKTVTAEVVTKFYYKGDAVEPVASDIKVTSYGMTLVPGVDYEVVPGSYTSNVLKGTATVTICGLKNYYGTKQVKFKIESRMLKSLIGRQRLQN